MYPVFPDTYIRARVRKRKEELERRHDMTPLHLGALKTLKAIASDIDTAIATLEEQDTLDVDVDAIVEYLVDLRSYIFEEEWELAGKVAKQKAEGQINSIEADALRKVLSKLGL